MVEEVSARGHSHRANLLKKWIYISDYSNCRRRKSTGRLIVLVSVSVWGQVNMVPSECDRITPLGKVFLAKEKNSGAIVAIKVIWFKNYIENGIQDQIKNEIEVRIFHLIEARFNRTLYIIVL